ncbi:MAG: hypothetical protein V4850_11535 [Myxococcota bacterium]
MIRVTKRAAAPAILVSEGPARAAEHAVELSSGSVPVRFERKLYHHPDVFQALVEDQHGKCCFCESKFLHVAFGDVEHFRPKAAWRQTRKGALRRPGYHWLAYTWENLHLSCEICNRREKGSLFPLLARSKRALSSADPLGAEAPAFLDPAADDPEAHIGFRGVHPFARDDSARGKATIAAIGLRRKELRERRLSWLAQLTLLRELTELARARPKDLVLARHGRRAEKALLAAQRNDAEYASMARCFLAPA